MFNGFFIKIIIMKKFSFIAMLLMAAWVFQSCNDSASDSIKSANESNEEKQDAAENKDNPAGTPDGSTAVTPVKEEDSEWVVARASSGMKEVQAAELAQQKAQNPRVKEFAAMLVKDHTAANEELKTLGMNKTITLPSAPGEDHKDHLDKLSKNSGKEFDKEFIDVMVKDHKKNIEAFEKASNDASDAHIKAFATKTLPVLRTHLEAAQSIEKELK